MIRRQVAMYKRLMVIMMVVFAVSVMPAQACTLFSASGGRTVDGGTLIAKVRDWSPTPQYWYRIDPTTGYSYYGLFIRSNGSGLRAGINEQGLVVVTATAGTIPKKDRLAIAGMPGGMLKYLLTQYASVAEIVNANIENWGSPQFIMIADKAETAYIEIAPDGQCSITREPDGVLYHTNHFINDELLWANYKGPGESSAARFARIKELMQQKQRFSIDDFIVITNDQHDGDNNSIWRVGNEDNPKSTQSMAAFIVHFTSEGDGEVYLKYRQNIEDKGNETIIRQSLKELFSKA